MHGLKMSRDFAANCARGAPGQSMTRRAKMTRHVRTGRVESLTQTDRLVARVGTRRDIRVRPARSAGARGVAASRAVAHGPRAPGPHAAGLGARQRGVPASDRPQADAVAESRALLRHVGASDAPDSCRLRTRQAERETGRRRARVTLDEALLPPIETSHDLVALDDALHALAAVHPRKSDVVELRYFGGLSLEETAEALHVSIDTVKRDWRFARLWLLRELGGRRAHGEATPGPNP